MIISEQEQTEDMIKVKKLLSNVGVYKTFNKPIYKNFISNITWCVEKIIQYMKANHQLEAENINLKRKVDQSREFLNRIDN